MSNRFITPRAAELLQQLERKRRDESDELARLRAENARLRAALEEALPWIKRGAHREITQRAEAALAGKENKG